MSYNNYPSNDSVMILDAAYDETMNQVIASILDQYPLSWKGKRTLVKPNILTGKNPDAGATTHPILVKAVVQQLKSRGADVIVGDNPGISGYGITEETARLCGILDAVEDSFINLAANPVKHTVSSRYFDYVMIAKEVLDADIIVNLPKLKTHGLTCITGAIKNTFGYIVGGDKQRIHSQAVTPRQFSEAILDIYKIKPPDLNIMDAVVAMEGNGPSNGTLRTLGKVVACKNAATLDAVAINLIGHKIKDVLHVKLAGEMGLGQVEVSNISIIGELAPVNGFILPTTFSSGISGIIMNQFLSNRINCVPKVITERCKLCQICVEHCPVDAMQISEDFPYANRDKCISCYCCQELCPEDAIILPGRLLEIIRRRSRKKR